MRKTIVQALAVVVLAAATVLAGESPLDNYALTMPNIRKMVTAYEAIDAAAKADPALLDRLSGADDESLGVDAIIAKHEAEPAIKKAFTAAGLSVRDGVLTLAALATAAGAVIVEEQTQKPAEGTPAARANVALYKANRAEIETLNGRLRSLGSLNPGRDDGGDDEED